MRKPIAETWYYYGTLICKGNYIAHDFFAFLVLFTVAVGRLGFLFAVLQESDDDRQELKQQL